MNLDTRWIKIKADDGQQTAAYRVCPHSGAQAAVLLLPEIFGVNEHIRACAHSYAEAGYAVLALATFDRVRQQVQLDYTPQDIRVGIGLKAAVERLPTPGVLADLQAGVDHLARATGLPVGVLGYCWGGLLAWRAAARLSEIRACVVYYGGHMTDPQERTLQPRVPVLAHLSRHDRSTPMTGIRSLQDAHPDVQVELYDAPHGFNCDQRPEWQASAAALARQRTLDFLRAQLGTPAAPN